MILKRKTPEERFAEELAKELERQAREMERQLPLEMRRDLELMEKNSPAVRMISKRIERGEIKLYWRRDEKGNLYIVARDTMKGWPFLRHGDYLLLPDGTDAYFRQFWPASIDWVNNNLDTWRPRALATVEWLDTPIEDWGYDGWYRVNYRCKVIARDGRKFLSPPLMCVLLETIDGTKTAHQVVMEAAARYAKLLYKHKFKKLIEEGKMSKKEADEYIRTIPDDCVIGLAVLRDLGLIV